MKHSKGKVTEVCKPFDAYVGSDKKIKDSSWTKIESQSIDLGRMDVHRRVQGQDLAAREVQRHDYCYNRFKLQHLSLRKKSQQEQDEKETERNASKAAHEKALQVVLGFIKSQVRKKQGSHSSFIKSMYMNFR